MLTTHNRTISDAFWNEALVSWEAHLLTNLWLFFSMATVLPLFFKFQLKSETVTAHT